MPSHRKPSTPAVAMMKGQRLFLAERAGHRVIGWIRRWYEPAPAHGVLGAFCSEYTRELLA